MTRPADEHSALRAVRGGLLVFSAPALAVAAHTSAHGVPPDASLTLVLTALVGWTGTALAGRTRGPLGLLAVLGVAQLVMHLLLSDLMSHRGGAELLPGPEMTAAHAAATVLTAHVVARAESLLVLVMTGLRVLLPVLWRPAPVPAAPVRATLARPAAPSFETVLLRRVRPRRGPPRIS